MILIRTTILNPSVDSGRGIVDGRRAYKRCGEAL